MGKKTTLAFLLGAATTGIVFGLLSLLSQKPSIATNHSNPQASVQAIASANPVKELKLTEVPSVAPTFEQPAVLPTQSTETAIFKELFLSKVDARSSVYLVKPGDNLTAISRKNNVTIDLIKKINGLQSDDLRPNMKLKMPSYKFSVVVDKSQNTLLLKGDEEVLKTYVVSTGEKNSTPIGDFKITDKIANPTWYKAGAVVPFGSADNVLGTRWLGFSKKGYGIHGTTEPDKLGQQVTAGCVRMKNEEVEELFSIVPFGTEVTIVD